MNTRMPKQVDISIMDKMAGIGGAKEYRNALASSRYNDAEMEHAKRLARVKRRKARMMAQKKKPEMTVMVADNEEY